MNMIVVDDYAALNQRAADMVAAVIAANPAATIVPATGNTPIGLYQELAARRARGQLETAQLRIFQLDEYLDLPPGDPHTLYGWMQRALLDPLGIPERNVVRLPAGTPDPAAACRAYEAAVAAAGGIDLGILGLGPNGHLGYNEPPSAEDAPTRVVDLTESSMETNVRYWGADAPAPRQALAAGMNVLLNARQTILLVTGAHKREILRSAVEGPVTPDLPASYLQQTPNVTIIADRAAWEG